MYIRLIDGVEFNQVLTDFLLLDLSISDKGILTLPVMIEICVFLCAYVFAYVV